MKDKLLKHSDIWVGVLAAICLYAILQIKFDEELRNSDISKVITAITLPLVKSFLDKEDTREKLATQVYGLWDLARDIKNLKDWK